MDLQQLRKEIDAVDDEILRLFVKRMEIAAKIGSCKKENGLPVTDTERECEKLDAVANQLPPDLAEYGTSLFQHLMELSKARQA